MARKRNYINNRSLYEAMVEYKDKLNIAIETGEAKPKVTKYIGESILLINNNLAKKPNFSGYTYKQEMISDGITDCLAAVDNFKPERSNNPFGYFTQIAKNAFIRRIHKEKKQTYIKHKNYELSMLTATSSQRYQIQQVKLHEASEEIINSFEEKLRENKSFTKAKNSAKIRVVGVEAFLEDKLDEVGTDN
jgi:hypothetical protein